MQYIVLCGNFSDDTINILKPHIDLTEAENISDSTCKEKKYILLKDKVIPDLKEKSGIIILFDDFSFNKTTNISSLSVILDSGNKKAVDFLSSINKSAISCSTSSKDTITISSLEENTATLSLLRTIISVNGVKKEPTDFSISINSQKNIYPQLAAYACLMALDVNFNTKKHKKI